MSRYVRPHSLDEALRTLSSGGLNVLAGGTDFYSARVAAGMAEDILDITAIDELRGVRETEQGFSIGALTTWSDIAVAKLPPQFDCLKLAAREIGGVQIQNSATVGGNLCNASPAADGVPALLALDAEVEIAHVRARRVLPLDRFIVGNRQTACAPGELVTAIRVPRWGDSARSHFLKLGARKYLVISIAMVAGIVEPDAHGRIARCAFAVGSCSAVAQRLTALELTLIGQSLDPDLSGRVRAEHLVALAPITDVRGTAEYRADAALALVRRTLAVLVGE